MDNKAPGHAERVIDWSGYLRKGIIRNAIWVERLKQVSGKLETWTSRASLDHTADWGVVMDSGFMGKLDWLDYSLKRSLGADLPSHEQELGTAQVIPTMEDIESYESTSGTIIRILEEMKG